MFSFITPKSLGTFKDPCGICYDNFKVGDVVRHHISSNLDHMHPIHVECPNMSGLYSNAQCPTCRSPYLSAREQKEVDHFRREAHACKFCYYDAHTGKTDCRDEGRNEPIQN